jgi:microcystin-dependent protein
MSSRLRYVVPSALSLLALIFALSSGTFAGAQGVPDLGLPPGTITAFGGPTPPPGWLPADGSEVSRTQYPDLFVAIGTTYGAGNGTTTFNLPDLRGRVAVDKGTASDVDSLNESDGLAVDSRKVHHRHGKGTIAITTPSGAHQHRIPWGPNTPGTVLQTPVAKAGFSDWINTELGDGAHTHPNSAFSGEVGDTSGPLDAPAYLVVNFIVKS